MSQDRSILVIDDSEADQFIMKTLIHKYDSTVDVVKALNGQEALQRLQTLKTHPDLILLDINMPGMNGHEFLKEYEKTYGKKSIVVMLTSSEQDQDKVKAHSHKSVKCYMVKPLSEKELGKIIS